MEIDYSQYLDPEPPGKAVVPLATGVDLEPSAPGRGKGVIHAVQRVQYNAPVTLTFTIAALAILGLAQLTHGTSNAWFSAYRTSFADPMQYLRLFTHVLGHANWAHFFGNFMIVLLIGPILEEKYGSLRLLLMIAVTAFITGLVNVLVSPNAIMGASGVVFMMILLASFVNLQAGRIPLTLILIVVLYVGQDVWSWITTDTNVAHGAHLLGGICGAVFGFLANGRGQTAAQNSQIEAPL